MTTVNTTYCELRNAMQVLDGHPPDLEHHPGGHDHIPDVDEMGQEHDEANDMPHDLVTEQHHHHVQQHEMGVHHVVDEQGHLMEEHSNGGGDEFGAQPSRLMLLEQDRFLPIANVSRIMRTQIPKNGKMAKDAKELVQECVSEFISFITAEANERCLEEKRKTVTADDLLDALSTLGFDDYVEPMRTFLDRYRKATNRCHLARPNNHATLYLVDPELVDADLRPGQSTVTVPTQQQQQHVVHMDRGQISHPVMVQVGSPDPSVHRTQQFPTSSGSGGSRGGDMRMPKRNEPEQQQQHHQMQQQHHHQQQHHEQQQEQMQMQQEQQEQEQQQHDQRHQHHQQQQQQVMECDEIELGALGLQSTGIQIMIDPSTGQHYIAQPSETGGTMTIIPVTVDGDIITLQDSSAHHMAIEEEQEKPPDLNQYGDDQSKDGEEEQYVEELMAHGSHVQEIDQGGAQYDRGGPSQRHHGGGQMQPPPQQQQQQQRQPPQRPRRGAAQKQQQQQQHEVVEEDEIVEIQTPQRKSPRNAGGVAPKRARLRHE